MYIGKEPQVGNYSVLDALTASSTNSYTMQLGSTNFTPESANHLIVSLNGVIQKPGSSFTVSGSTITFIPSSGTLSSSDSIDFIIALGNVLDIGTPSDNTIATAKIIDDAVTAAKFNADVISGQTELAAEPADTDEFLVSDAGVLKRIDYSLIKASPGLNLISTTNVSSASTVDITGMDSTYKQYKIVILNLHSASDNVTLNGRAIIGGSANSSAYYSYVNHFIKHDGTPTHELNSSLDATSWKLIKDGLGNATTENLMGEFIINNPSETTFEKLMTGVVGYTHYDASRASNNIGTYCYNNGTAAWTGIQFFMNTGNIDSAIIKLYGIS